MSGGIALLVYFVNKFIRITNVIDLISQILTSLRGWYWLNKLYIDSIEGLVLA